MNERRFGAYATCDDVPDMIRFRYLVRYLESALLTLGLVVSLSGAGWAASTPEPPDKPVAYLCVKDPNKASWEMITAYGTVGAAIVALISAFITGFILYGKRTVQLVIRRFCRAGRSTSAISKRGMRNRPVRHALRAGKTEGK